MDLKAVVGLVGGVAIAVALAGTASAATIRVNSAADSAADDGVCTLREAISAANDNAGSGSSAGECVAGDAAGSGTADAIVFAIPGQGPFVISPTTSLPLVTETVLIDGYSQNGAKANTLRSGNDAVLMLELRGDVMTPVCDPSDRSPVEGGAFQFVGAGASGSRLRGFAIGDFQGDMGAVMIFRAGAVQIDGNWIGFDAAGSERPNFKYGVVVMNGVFTQIEDGQSDVVIDDGGPGNLVGGQTPQERNVISDSRSAIFLGGQRNRIEGNYIGVNPQGDKSLPNLSHAVVAGRLGILSCQSPKLAFRFDGNQNSIGSLRSRNFFSAESNDCAVRLDAADNRVEGNDMGTDRDGRAGASGAGLGAQPGCGVLVEGSLAVRNSIAWNTIAFNAKGVVVRSSKAGGVPTGNDIHRNSIHTNVGLGIDLENDDVTPNDPGDSDRGSNGLQNFPERLEATVAGVRGSLQARPNTAYRIDLYQSRRCGPGGHGQGEQPLADFSLLTDASGRADFSVSVHPELESFVTATATSIANPMENGSASEGTSEFSECAIVTSGSGVSIEILSSRDPARSREAFALTVLVHGGNGAVPTGTVVLWDQAAGQGMAHGTLKKSAVAPDTGEVVIPSSKLALWNSLWGNRRIQARYSGDSVYAPTYSMEFVQTIYREKSDLDGDGLSDVLLCDGSNGKFLVQDLGGSFSTPLPVPALGPGRTVLGTGVFGGGFEPAVVWRDSTGAIGGTLFSGATPGQDFSVPLSAGLTFEALGSMYGDLKDDFIAHDGSGRHFGQLSSLLVPGGGLGLLAPWPVTPPFGAPNSLVVERVGDFNGDGNLDWLLRNPPSGQYTIWLLGGAFNVLSGGSGSPNPPDPGATVADVADFDGDGRSDIAWRLPGATGSVGTFQITLQDGLSVKATLPPGGSASQQAVGTAFFDDGSGASGGRASLIVRNTASGQLDAWINTGLASDGSPTFVTRPMAGGGLTVCSP